MNNIELFIFVFLFIVFLYILNCKMYKYNDTFETYKNDLNSNLIEVNYENESEDKDTSEDSKYKQKNDTYKIKTTDYPECLSSGFCKGIFESKIPKGLQEYSVINYSDKASNQSISNLQQISNKQHNLSVGDTNYQYQPPPNKTTFT